MNERATKFGEYFNLPNPGLLAYFQHVIDGQPEEYRTPFYKGKTLKQITYQWDRKLRAIKDKWPSLYEYESDQRSKIGPMSIMKPLSQRYDDIEAYYSLINAKESEPLLNEAINSVVAEFKAIRGLRLRDQKRTVDVMKKSTSSGSPYFSRRKIVVSKTIPCRSWIDGDLVHSKLADTEWLSCAVLGWRGQEGGPEIDDVKQRVIWMFPFAVNIEELQVYQPLIKAAQVKELVPAWVSMDLVDKRITQMFDTKRPEDLVICTDFSKFDQHFNRNMQTAAYMILRYILANDSRSLDWLDRVFPIKYMIPLAIKMGSMAFGPHGMASGSGGTNADETLAHRALQYEAAIKAGSKLNPHSQCLGDDGVLTYPGISVDDVIECYTAHGLEMNTSKQYASKQDCTYLRRWHHTEYRAQGICVGVYPTMRALGRLCEQERYYDPETWSKEMVALRQLSIIENCSHHPLFEAFVEFCMAGDKYRLGLDIPGFLENLPQLAKKSIEYMPDFLGYTKTLQDPNVTGIANWRVVQYLKSLK